MDFRTTKAANWLSHPALGNEPICSWLQAVANSSPEAWILAVVGRRKLCGHAFLPPYFLAGSARIGLKMRIAFFEISVDCCLRLCRRLIIAVMDDGTSHTAEDRFNHIKKLRAGWKWRDYDGWTAQAAVMVANGLVQFF